MIFIKIIFFEIIIKIKRIKWIIIKILLKGKYQKNIELVLQIGDQFLINI